MALYASVVSTATVRLTAAIRHFQMRINLISDHFSTKADPLLFDHPSASYLAGSDKVILMDRKSLGASLSTANRGSGTVKNASTATVK